MHVIALKFVKNLVLNILKKRVHFSTFQPIFDIEMTLNISQKKDQTTTRSILIVQYQKIKNAYDCHRNRLEIEYFYSEKAHFPIF